MKVTLTRSWRRFWIGYEWIAELRDERDGIWGYAGIGYAFTKSRAQRHAWRCLAQFLNTDETA